MPEATTPSSNPDAQLEALAESAAGAFGYTELPRTFLPFSLRDWRKKGWKPKRGEYHPGVVLYFRAVTVLFPNGKVEAILDGRNLDLWRIERRGEVTGDELEPLHRLLLDGGEWGILADAWREERKQSGVSWTQRKETSTLPNPAWTPPTATFGNPEAAGVKLPAGRTSRKASSGKRKK